VLANSITRQLRVFSLASMAMEERVGERRASIFETPPSPRSCLAGRGDGAPFCRSSAAFIGEICGSISPREKQPPLRFFAIFRGKRIRL